MKIREKLSVSFIAVASATLLLLGVVAYIFMSFYRKSEFNVRLKQRIEVTEQMFLEKENFSAEAFQIIQEQFLNKLPEETEEVLILNDTFRDQLEQHYPEEFLTNLLDKKEAFFEAFPKQGAGRIFHIRGNDYLVLLTAVDQIGIKLMDHFLTIVFVGLVVCMAVMGLVGHIVSGNVLNPISRKIKKANSISAKNLHERLNVYNPEDELGQLAIAFNNLLDRVATAFDTQRSFIDNASHEIRNPLTAIMGETEYALERDRTKEEYVSSLKAVSAEADRLNILVNNLLKLSNISYKKASFSIEIVDLKEMLKASKEKLDFLNPENKVALKFNSSDEFFIQGNKHLLETAFINLMDNASKFSYNEHVEVSLMDKEEGLVTISIIDKGVGIPEEDIEKVTQPFHRAKNVIKIKGTGIGIPLSLKIVELHGGSLLLKSQINEGTEVLVSLPIVRLI